MNVKPNNPASRWWCLTVNNPDADSYKQLNDLYDSGVCHYLCYAKEHFDTEGKTPHLQVYAEFRKPCRFTALKKAIPKAHIEPKRGSRSQARNYCFKEVAPTELGEFKDDRSGQRNDIVAVKRKLDDGASMEEVADDHFASWLRYNGAFKKYRSLMGGKRRWKTQVYVLWGDPESGKTAYVHDNCVPCVMSFANGFWSPYDGEQDVLWDDFNPSQIPREHFLQLCDRYPMKIRQIGGWTEWIPRRIFITSNHDPKYWYGTDEPAVQRRLDTVKKFKFDPNYNVREECMEE